MFILNKSILLFCLLLNSTISFANAPEKNTIFPSKISSQIKNLKGGFFILDPYQYLKYEEGNKRIAGLDIQLMKFLANQSNEKIEYIPMDWHEQFNQLKTGALDFATGATFTHERTQYVHYSLPYRYEENSLFIPRVSSKNPAVTTLPILIEHIKQSHFRLGVVEGYMYADPSINQFIQDPLNAKYIYKSKNDYESLNLLLNGEIDGFLADRMVGATVIWRSHVGHKVIEHPLKIRTPIHIMFSKNSVPFSTVEKFNKEIKNFIHSNKYHELISWYLYPVLLLQTISTRWFILVEIIGTVAFAISGLIIAFRDKATLFGAFIFALLPSLGGGIVRDVIFGRNPVGALRSPIYLLSVISTVLLGFMLLKLAHHITHRYKISHQVDKLLRQQASHALLITDAIGLASFTVVGVVVSILAKADPLWLWGPFFAFVTGAGGGILRDMISKTRYIASLEGELYAEISIFWGFALSMSILHSTKDIHPELIQLLVIITLLGAFSSRILAYYLRLPNVYFSK